MIDIHHLCAFLVRAKKSTYAIGDKANKKIEQDLSTSLSYREGDWMYHDNYFGGEPYGGREVVAYKDHPIYIMTYYGCVYKNIPDIKTIYTFLQHALSLITEQYPYRGPQHYNEATLSYINTFSGDIHNFSGEEIITQEGEEVYKANYMGGFVDQRK